MIPLPSHIKVYNTLTRKHEDFEPFDPPYVKMYVCGPTVYDESHIGHARTYVAFDAIRRYLERRGYHVIYVQNITDIDDKIIQRALEERIDWRDIVERYTGEYLDQLKKLGITPLINPRVTYHIAEIIGFIQKLIDKGYAYSSGGSVYFDANTYEHYGELSRRLEKTMWRQEDDVLKEKRNPYDFALWKKRKENEPYWESPWGPGRPGWHIECSVMSTRYLGTRIDIHGGGQDLIFPHHENERAQSEALLGVRPWVKYWMHTGMLTVRGEKMSKSLGNIITLKELLQKYKPGVIRTWILSAHYRSQLEFNEHSIEQATRNHNRIMNVMREIDSQLSEAQPTFYLNDDELAVFNKVLNLFRGFHEAMSDDFNTSEAMKYVMEATNIYHKYIEGKESFSLLITARMFFELADHVYGFSVGEESKVIAEREKELLKLIIETRSVLREKKEYDLADRIRDKLLELGIRLYDKGKETRYVIEK